jgi:hypothetical protein
MKICPVGAELFQPEGRTDMTKLLVAFHNFANAPNTEIRDIKIMFYVMRLYKETTIARLYYVHFSKR